jgi:hypothetical protein
MNHTELSRVSEKRDLASLGSGIWVAMLARPVIVQKMPVAIWSFSAGFRSAHRLAGIANRIHIEVLANYSKGWLRVLEGA